MPFASTSPELKSARKRAGTVSRFFASREYSAVPSKAIRWAHGKKSDRGGGVGGAPPPRSGEALVSHSPPRSNPNRTKNPTEPLSRPPEPPNSACPSAFSADRRDVRRMSISRNRSCIRSIRNGSCMPGGVPSAGYASVVGRCGGLRAPYDLTRDDDPPLPSPPGRRGRRGSRDPDRRLRLQQRQLLQRRRE